MREVEDRVPPAGDADPGVPAADVVRRARRIVIETERPCERDRHLLYLRDPRESRAQLAGVREIERKRHPFVGVAAEFADRRVLQSRLDRQQSDRRRLGGVEEKFGGAHRRAARRRGQQARAEVGKEDRVDELRFAAGELGDERDDELVLAQPLEQLPDPEIDLRVGEILFAQPRVHCPDAVRQAIAPIAVGLEAGREFT